MFDITAHDTFSPEFKKHHQERIMRELAEQHWRMFETRHQPRAIPEPPKEKTLRDLSTNELHQLWNEILERVSPYKDVNPQIFLE